MISRGYCIFADNTEEVDYVKCAIALARSLRKVMPQCSITLLSNSVCDDTIFDSIIPITTITCNQLDPFKIGNDCQIYNLSPYQETIKLEADMIMPRNIDYWWDVLSLQDVVISTKIRNFKGDISTNRFYRKFIDDNNLPDVYNALTYFKKSVTAEKFFLVVRDILEHWNEYKTILKCKTNEEMSTDWVYAIASHIIGVEKTTLPCFDEFSMTHMKQHINGLTTENWTDSLVYECFPDVLRINTFVQQYPFHYHIKKFAEKYERI